MKMKYELDAKDISQAIAFWMASGSPRGLDQPTPDTKTRTFKIDLNATNFNNHPFGPNITATVETE